MLGGEFWAPLDLSTVWAHCTRTVRLTEEIKSNVVSSSAIPATSPRMSQRPHDNTCSRSLGFWECVKRQEVLGDVGKLVRIFPYCCEDPWIGNCGSWGRRVFQKEAGFAVSAEEFAPCRPFLSPSSGRRKPGRNWLLLVAKHLKDLRPFKNYLHFPDLGDILITHKHRLDNKENKRLRIFFVSIESYIIGSFLLCGYN